MYNNLRFVTDLLVWLAVPVVLLVVAAGAVEAGTPDEFPAERLILGFEKAELGRGDVVSREEKPGRESWFYLLEQPEGFDFAARFEWPGATNRPCGQSIATMPKFAGNSDFRASERGNLWQACLQG